MKAYYFQCSKGHILAVKLSKQGCEKFYRLCSKGLRVCPSCPGENQHLLPLEEPTKSNIDTSKAFSCKEGHISVAYLFGNGILNLKWGDDAAEYENFTGLTPKEFLGLIMDGKIKCRHSKETKLCNKKIKEIDNTPLLPPPTFGIKTKKRLGDIWSNIEPRETSTNSDGSIDQTNYGKAVRERIKKLRKERLTTPAGTPLKKPTNTSYKDSRDRKPTKKDLE